MNHQDGRTMFSLGIELSGLRNDAQAAINEFSNISRKAEAEGAKIDNAFNNVKKAVAAYFTAQQLYDFANAVVHVRGEIESLQIAFETLLGGDKHKAIELFTSLKEFAVNTPMQLGDLAKGAQTLLGFGVAAERVMPILRQIGDISMGNRDKFNSLTLAFSQMSSTGKLMGQDLLQMINAGFNPLVEISKMTGKSVAELKDEMSAGAISTEMVASAYEHATAQGGTFYGMLEKQSKGIQGALSNLAGAWDDMLNNIGTKQQGIFVDGVNMATDAVKHYEDFGKAILALAATYGTYKAVLASVVVLQRSQMLIENIRLIMMFRKELGLLRAAQQAFNITAMANPYVLLASAIVGVATALYLYADRSTTAEKAQKGLNEKAKEYTKHVDEVKEKTDEYIQVIQDKTATDLQQLEAYEQLRHIAPSITDAYSKEELAVADLADAKKRLNKQLEEDNMENLKKNLEKYTWLLKEATEAHGNWMNMSKDAQEIMREELKPGYLPDKITQLNIYIDSYRNQIARLLEKKAELEEKSKPLDIQIVNAKANLKQIENEFELAKKKMDEEKAKLRGKWNGLIPIEVQLKFEVSKRDMQNAIKKVDELQSQRKSSTTYGEEYKSAQDKWNKAKKLLAEISKDKAKFTKAQYLDAVAAEEKAKKAYKALGGEVDAKQIGNARKEKEQKAKELAAYQEMQAQQAVSKLRIAKDSAFALAQAEIDAMDESSERISAQMQLNHKREIEQLRREKEDFLAKKRAAEKTLFESNPDNKGKVFNSSAVILSSEEEETFKKRRELLIQKQNSDNEEMVQRQRMSMNAYLKEFGGYLEKRAAIIDDYNIKMEKATAKGEKLSLAANMERDLSKLDIEANRKTSAITRLFEDMSHKSVKQLREIASEAEKALKFLLDGKWDETKGIEFGITQETFNNLKKSPEELERIRKGINNIKASADQLDGALGKIIGGFKKLFEAGSDWKTGLSQITDGMNEATNAAGFLADSFFVMGDSFDSQFLKSIGEGLEMVTDTMQSTARGAQAGAIFGPIGASAGAAVGLVTSLASSIAKIHDRKNERRIARIQRQVDVLKDSYDKLGRSIENSFSKDASKMIQQQDTLLAQQKALIREQIREEEKKKKTNHNRIAQWENEIKEIDNIIASNKEKAIDVIFGQDIKSAISQFEEAYIKAWEAGDDKMKSSRDMARTMIRQMIMEAMKMDLAQPMKELRETTKNFLEDGIIDSYEERTINNAMDSMTRELDYKYKWADKYIKKTEDLEKQADESFNNFFDGFINQLSEKGTDATKIADSIAEDMRKTLIKAFVTKEYEAEMKEYFKKWNEAKKDNRITKEEMESLDKMRDAIIKKAADAVNEINEQFGALSGNKDTQEFTSYFDSLINELYDYGITARDMSRKISDDMRKELIKTYAIENYKGEMRDWYSKWQKKMKAGILTDEERIMLENQKDDIIKRAVADIQKINEKFGVEEIKQDQGTSRGFAALNQDSIDQLNGRFTAIQIDTSQIRLDLTSAKETMILIQAQIYSIKETMAELKGITMMAITRLEGIEKNTRQLYEINDRLNQIERNTHRL